MATPTCRLPSGSLGVFSADMVDTHTILSAGSRNMIRALSAVAIVDASLTATKAARNDVLPTSDALSPGVLLMQKALGVQGRVNPYFSGSQSGSRISVIIALSSFATISRGTPGLPGNSK